MSLSNIKSWSTAAASNNDAATGGMPENQAPSTVNDYVRLQMAAHRTQWEDAEWFNWGHTIAFSSASEFTATITGTYSSSGTNVYAVNRRVKCYDGSSTFYGAVVSVSAAAANQWKVSVSLDSGALTSSLTQVAVAILSPTNALPQACFRAHKNGVSTQTIADSTTTKVTFGTESFDVGGQYDASNSKLQPTSPGKWRVTARLSLGSTPVDGKSVALLLYKNGSEYSRINVAYSQVSVDELVEISDLVSLNGSTDYVEVYVSHNFGSDRVVIGTTTITVFMGERI